MLTRHVHDSIFRYRNGVKLKLPWIILKRRDSWPSRSVARAWLGSRLPWKRWDPRVFDKYAVRILMLLPLSLSEIASQEHCLCNVLTSETNPKDRHPVRIMCDKNQETAAYAPHIHVGGADQLGVICPLVPVHAIFGTRADIMYASHF